MALETAPATLEVVRHEAADQEDIFRFYAETFGQDLTEGSRRRWQWQYAENPAARTEGPSIWVAREGTAVLGQYASMPVALWWGGREVRSSWGMDVFLRPEARGKGVGARLFTAWSDHVEVALGLGLTPSSYGLFKKLRYHDVGPVPFFQKVLDARAVARRRLGPVAGTLAAPVLVARLVAAAPGPAPRAAGVDGRAHRRRSARSSTRSGSARAPRTRCACGGTRRTSTGSTPPARTARTTCGPRARGACSRGFAVSRHEDYRGLRLGWIVDVFADASRRGREGRAVSARARLVPRGGRRARAGVRAERRRCGDDLRRRGFRQARVAHAVLRAHARRATTPLSDRGRWHVMFGDSDMDR